MEIQTQSFESIFDQYSKALDWFQELGINLSSGRTRHYENVFKYWSENYETSSREEADEAFPDFVGSTSEILDFVDIYNSLKSVNGNELNLIVNKLQEGVNGPISAASETNSSTKARNYIFEAAVAAKLHSPRDGIETIFQSKTDTGIRIGKKNIWIECKRVSSENKIEANVKKAIKQLNGQFKKAYSSGNKGIVALEYSKLLNKGDQIYVAPNDDELRASTERIATDFINDKARLLARLYEGKNKKIIGTLFRFSTMATSEERNLLVRVVEWGISPRINNKFSDNDLLNYIAHRIDKKI